MDEVALVVSLPTDEKVTLIQTLEYQTKSGKGNSSTHCPLGHLLGLLLGHLLPILGHLALLLIEDELVK